MLWHFVTLVSEGCRGRHSASPHKQNCCTIRGAWEVIRRGEGGLIELIYICPAVYKAAACRKPLHSVAAMAFSTLLTVLVLIHNTGGLLGAEVRSSIIGGQDAKEGRWPGMVHVNLTDGKGVKWRCGGTILTDQWVLTAANCWNRDPAPVWRRSFVAVGLHKLQKAGSRYMEISTVMSHTAYNPMTYINDIALVKLKKTIKFMKNVAPVSLDRDDTFGPSSDCWIVGWGYKGINDPLPDPETLQELKISIIPHSVCKAKYPALTPDQLCAGDLKDGGKDACQVSFTSSGDYGGPLMCRAADGGYVQVGIMSYGNPAGCGLPGSPGVYTKVFKYLPFIDAYTKQGEEAPDCKEAPDCERPRS